MLDLDAMLALNAAHEKETSVLDLQALRALVDQAFHLGRRGDGGDGFMIALDQDAVYASANFAWFKARYPKFVYVDRVIVAAHARGGGLARAMYEELFAVSARKGHRVVCAEVYKIPPNPISDAFHARLGFEIIGEADSADGSKTMRYMARNLDD